MFFGLFPPVPMTIVSLDDEIERVYEYTSKEELKPLAAFPLRLGTKRFFNLWNSIHNYKDVDFQAVRDPRNGDVYKLKFWRILKAQNPNGGRAILQSKIYKISKLGDSTLIGSFVYRSPCELALIAGRPTILDPFSYQSVWTTVSNSTFPLPQKELNKLFLSESEKMTVRKLIKRFDDFLESMPPSSPTFDSWAPSWSIHDETAINRKYKAVCVFGKHKISVD